MSVADPYEAREHLTDGLRSEYVVNEQRAHPDRSTCRSDDDPMPRGPAASVVARSAGALHDGALLRSIEQEQAAVEQQIGDDAVERMKQTWHD